MGDVNFLRSVTLFCDMQPQELEDLDKSFHTTHFAAGDVILDQGKANRAYFEMNRSLIENPTFREAYAMCNR